MNVAEICNLLENVVNAHDPRDTAYEIMCQLERSAEAPKRGMKVFDFTYENYEDKLIGNVHCTGGGG